jgi:hypothetical protein
VAVKAAGFALLHRLAERHALQSAVGRTRCHKAVYNILGINRHGHKELLGVYLSESEGANFWISVFTDLQQWGVQYLPNQVHIFQLICTLSAYLYYGEVHIDNNGVYKAIRPLTDLYLLSNVVAPMPAASGIGFIYLRVQAASRGQGFAVCLYKCFLNNTLFLAFQLSSLPQRLN